jgi:hypothetical protein
MRDQKCDECQRLWQEYSRATTDHIRLDSKLRLAALSYDQEGILVLTRQVEGAEEQREWAREAIRKHEATHETTHVEDAAAD